MFWIMENRFLFAGLFDWGNAETQRFSVSWNRDGFTMVASRTRKSGTVAPLKLTKQEYINYFQIIGIRKIYVSCLLSIGGPFQMESHQ